MKDVICSDWVLHLADHESTHLMVFCPKFYFQSCHRVWSDEKVFKPMFMSIPAAKLFLCSHVPSDILRKYPCGDSTWMPNYLQDRFFSSGKSLLSQVVRSSVTRTQLWGLSLEQPPFAWLNWVWPGSLSRSVPQIWSEIHALFAQCPAHLDLELLNDDLVGFFNSVPQVRILEAVDMLVRMYRTSYFEVQLSVCINEKSKHSRSVQGKISNIRRHMDWETMDPVDLATIVRLSFECGLFVALNRVWKQVDGTSIENQISPVLSSLPVVMTELGWSASFPQVVNFPLTFLSRYVDNRLVIAPRDVHRTLPFQVFSHETFYGHPIVLEPVGNGQFLGL